MQPWSFLIYNFITKKCNAVIKFSYYAEDFAELEYTQKQCTVFTVSFTVMKCDTKSMGFSTFNQKCRLCLILS